MKKYFLLLFLFFFVFKSYGTRLHESTAPTTDEAKKNSTCVFKKDFGAINLDDDTIIPSCLKNTLAVFPTKKTPPSKSATDWVDTLIDSFEGQQRKTVVLWIDEHFSILLSNLSPDKRVPDDVRYWLSCLEKALNIYGERPLYFLPNGVQQQVYNVPGKGDCLLYAALGLDRKSAARLISKNVADLCAQNKDCRRATGKEIAHLLGFTNNDDMFSELLLSKMSFSVSVRRLLIELPLLAGEKATEMDHAFPQENYEPLFLALGSKQHIQQFSEFYVKPTLKEFNELAKEAGLAEKKNSLYWFENGEEIPKELSFLDVLAYALGCAVEIFVPKKDGSKLYRAHTSPFRQGDDIHPTFSYEGCPLKVRNVIETSSTHVDMLVDPLFKS